MIFLWDNVMGMIKQCSLYVVALLAFTTTLCAQEVTRMMLIKNIPVVKGSINGKDAYFIIDTGSSVTLLNNAMAKYYDFSTVANDYLDRYYITGVGGKCRLFDIRDAEVRFGSLRLDFINKGCALEEISKHFTKAKIKIAGIIGTDVLVFLGSEICYSDTTIVFYNKPR